MRNSEIDWQIDNRRKDGRIVVSNRDIKIRVSLDDDVSLTDCAYQDIPESLKYYIELLATKYRRAKTYQQFARS